MLNVYLFLSLDSDRRGLVWGDRAVCFGAELEPWAEDPRCSFSSPFGPPCMIWEGGRSSLGGPSVQYQREAIYTCWSCHWCIRAGVGSWVLPMKWEGTGWPLGEVISGLHESPVFLLALSSLYIKDLWYFLLKHEHLWEGENFTSPWTSTL